MSSKRSAGASASFQPRIQLANVPVSILIFFGMWLCYEASSGRPLPYPALLDPLKAAGLFVFRTEWLLRGVFWAAVVAHIYEGALAMKFAARVCAPKVDVPFILFWTIQTAAVGFPSLKLIKEQRRQQAQANKQNGGTADANKTQ